MLVLFLSLNSKKRKIWHYLVCSEQHLFSVNVTLLFCSTSGNSWCKDVKEQTNKGLSSSNEKNGTVLKENNMETSRLAWFLSQKLKLCFATPSLVSGTKNNETTPIFWYKKLNCCHRLAVCVAFSSCPNSLSVRDGRHFCKAFLLSEMTQIV